MYGDADSSVCNGYLSGLNVTELHCSTLAHTRAGRKRDVDIEQDVEFCKVQMRSSTVNVMPLFAMVLVMIILDYGYSPFLLLGV